MMVKMAADEFFVLSKTDKTSISDPFQKKRRVKTSNPSTLLLCRVGWKPGECTPLKVPVLVFRTFIDIELHWQKSRNKASCHDYPTKKSPGWILSLSKSIQVATSSSSKQEEPVSTKAASGHSASIFSFGICIALQLCQKLVGFFRSANARDFQKPL